jgi:hypothetical protein
MKIIDEDSGELIDTDPVAAAKQEIARMIGSAEAMCNNLRSIPEASLAIYLALHQLREAQKVLNRS